MPTQTSVFNNQNIIYGEATSGIYDVNRYDTGAVYAGGVSPIIYADSARVSHSLAGGFYTNTNSFYSGKLNLSLSSSLFTNTNVFYSGRLGLSVVSPFYQETTSYFNSTVSQRLTGAFYTNTSTLYTGQLNLALSAPLFTNTNNLYSGSIRLRAEQTSTLTNTNTFYGATLDVEPPPIDQISIFRNGADNNGSGNGMRRITQRPLWGIGF